MHDENGHGSNFSDRDLAETPLASQSSDLLETIEPCDQPACQDQRMDTEQVWDILRRLVGDLMTHNNAQLSLECLALPLVPKLRLGTHLSWKLYFLAHHRSW